MVFTSHVVRELKAELGSYEAVWQWFLDQQGEGRQAPIFVGVPGPDGNGSLTVIIPPRGWTPERTQGFLAGHREILEDEFGAISGVETLGQDRPLCQS
jgi:hypothetical protein